MKKVVSFINLIGSIAPYILAIGLSIAGTSYYLKKHLLQAVDPNSKEKVSFLVENGDNWKTVSKKLEEKKLLKKWWSIYSLIKAKEAFEKGKNIPQIKIGEYQISPSYTPIRIIKAFADREIIYHKVTITEGTSTKEIPKLLSDTGLVSKTDVQRQLQNRRLMVKYKVSAETMEGYLYPDTYQFTKPVNAEQMIATILEKGLSVREKYKERADELQMSMHDILTLASMIEKETGDPSERATISSVFHNRLKINMRLQSDPTVIYGIEDFDGNLTKEHLREPHPYNTYTNTGLPPTPIANPGEKAIEAALFPETTDYLYFVAKGDGSHKFSSNYKDHKDAVNEYQRKRKKK